MTQTLLRKLCLLSASTCLFGLGSLAHGAPRVDYVAQVKPLLKAKCYACHGALKQESNLRLDTRAQILIGGDGGPAVTPSASGESPLLARVAAADELRMPPHDEGAPLSKEEVDVLRHWIDQGAEGPDEPLPPDPRAHWAFQRPQRAPLPSRDKKEGIDDAGDVGNAIDALLDAERAPRKLVSVGLADKRILLRRVYLDLIGLPPTRAEMDNFLADDSSDAYERVVDRLLNHPGYSERWGRHWMDVWRYTDWYGLEEQVRYSQKHIWRWREWIVRSIADDKPYSRMIVEMLAGDEIAPMDPQILAATGFLARNYFLFNRTTWLDATVEHTAKGFLGLTVNCAKCHDHKYDPIPQTDYYQMRAVFEPHQVRLDPVPGETNLDVDGLPRAFDNEPEAPTYVFVRGDEKSPNLERMMRPGGLSVLGGELQPTALDLPPEAYAPELQEFALRDHLAKAEQQIASAQQALEEARQTLASAASDADAAPRLAVAFAEKKLHAAILHPRALETAFAADRAKAHSASSGEVAALVQAAATAARHYELARAEEAVVEAEQQVSAADEGAKPAAMENLAAARAKSESAQKGLESPGESYTSLYVSRRAANGMVDEETPRHGPYSRTSTGRRTALAEWIANRDNPLTARVAVNHIWMRHFGQPLVESVFDFGLRTPAPPQQRLLDWLAVEFMERDWSMKHMHRLMVTSRAYRLSSSMLNADASTLQTDPNNNYYWHRRTTRMESQMVRDSLLHVAGVLDPERGGPNLKTSLESDLFRRTLYFTHASDDRGKFTAMFDDADVLECYRRRESIIPQQALALSNSKLAMAMAEKIADNLHKDYGDACDEDFVDAAFETILLVKPNRDENAACCSMLRETIALLGRVDAVEASRRARRNLVHALLNHNDFLVIR